MRIADILQDGHFTTTTVTDGAITGITADSRQVEPGFVFVALNGSKTQGSAFIKQALERGAVAVVLDNDTPAPKNTNSVILRSPNPRLSLSYLAKLYYPKQPPKIAAVTGTNGKSSTVSFTRQLWDHLGIRAASIGTLGVIAKDMEKPLALTTPDAIALHRHADELSQLGYQALALEASSHGLDQYRLDNLTIGAAAFTNLTRDHLDYHKTMAAYFKAKGRLFSDVLRDDGTAVINMDAEYGAAYLDICTKRRLRTFTTGFKGKDIKLTNIAADGRGQKITLEVFGKPYSLSLGLVGDFQVFNACAALGLVLGFGADTASAVDGMRLLIAVRGRLEEVAVLPNGTQIYVDYAHTPDALEIALKASKKHARGKLHVVFGCGGDRDGGKRPIMGEIAARIADVVVVTDDNPRSEDPASIRAAIMQGCPKAENIGDRERAIKQAVQALQAGDVLVIAGKGHERGQIIGNTVKPFDDASVVRAVVADLIAQHKQRA